MMMKTDVTLYVDDEILLFLRENVGEELNDVAQHCMIVLWNPLTQKG